MEAHPGGAAARAEYLHRLNKKWSLFGAGDIGFTKNAVDWSAQGGIRGQW